MSEFSTTENNFPIFPIPTNVLDIKLLSIWLFRITACTHVKGRVKGLRGYKQSVSRTSIPYSCRFFHVASFPSISPNSRPLRRPTFQSFLSYLSHPFLLPIFPGPHPPPPPSQPSATLEVCNGYYTKQRVLWNWKSLDLLRS